MKLLFDGVILGACLPNSFPPYSLSSLTVWSVERYLLSRPVTRAVRTDRRHGINNCCCPAVAPASLPAQWRHLEAGLAFSPSVFLSFFIGGRGYHFLNLCPAGGETGTAVWSYQVFALSNFSIADLSTASDYDERWLFVRKDPVWPVYLFSTDHSTI